MADLCLQLFSTVNSEDVFWLLEMIHQQQHLRTHGDLTGHMLMRESHILCPKAEGWPIQSPQEGL